MTITPANGAVTRTVNFNIFNGGKIRVDLTNTKYKLLRECALEMKWKVITAKKKTDGDTNEKPATDAKGKKEPSAKHMTQHQIEV